MSQAFIPPSYSSAPDVSWSTADLCDQAMGDEACDLRVLPPLYRSYGGHAWYFGQVYAVRATHPDSAMSLAGVLSGAGNGRVLLVDAQGNAAQAVLGDRMAGIAVQNGWCGVVIHGYARDTQLLGRMPLGVHALGAVPNRAIEMPAASACGEVSLHGKVIRTGDWLYADEDGIVVLAKRHTELTGAGQ